MVGPVGVRTCEWIWCSIALVVLICRLYVRQFVVRTGLHFDDLFLIIAQLCFIGWVACDVLLTINGLMDGDHSYYDSLAAILNGSPNNIFRVLKVSYISVAPYYTCLWAIKGAFIAFYWKLIPKNMPRTRLALYFTTAFTAVTWVLTILLNFFYCQPISLNWSTSPTSFCYAAATVLVFSISSAFHIVTDVFIIMLPFPVARGMKNLTPRQKAGLYTTFSLGAIIIVIGLVKVVFLAFSGSISQAAVFTATECGAAQIVACFPAMRTLLQRHFWARFRSRLNRKSAMDDESLSDVESSTLDSGLHRIPMTKKLAALARSPSSHKTLKALRGANIPCEPQMAPCRDTRQAFKGSPSDNINHLRGKSLEDNKASEELNTTCKSQLHPPIQAYERPPFPQSKTVNTHPLHPFGDIQDLPSGIRFVETDPSRPSNCLDYPQKLVPSGYLEPPDFTNDPLPVPGTATSG